MPVSYEYIDDILTSHGLANPQLHILVADHQLYSTMVYQHKGILTAVVTGDKFIGNTDQQVAANKHLAFFELAAHEAADLVMTPEYSCPTAVLTQCLASAIFPTEGQLWTIGCESFRPGDLRDFIAQNTTDDTLIIAEEPACQSNADKLLDPVAYLFRTKPAVGGPAKKVILFQFKTFPMGATGIEAENLLFGTRRFVFRNDENSIYLATILCSESMDIDLIRDLKQFVDKPYVLLHPQMNKGSRTDALKRYRTDFYNACAEDTEKDLICLNWASGSKAGADNITYGNSAIYLIFRGC